MPTPSELGNPGTEGLDRQATGEIRTPCVRGEVPVAMPLASKAGVSIRPEAWGLLQVAAVRGLPVPFCLQMPTSDKIPSSQ